MNSGAWIVGERETSRLHTGHRTPMCAIVYAASQRAVSPRGLSQLGNFLGTSATAVVYPSMDIYR